MVREIVHDPILLSKKSETATKYDVQTAYDLLDTLKFHSNECVGMAANMIGINKSIIVFINNDNYEIMFNPEITKCSDAYKTEEGCLSLIGNVRPCKRYNKITVKWQNEKFQTRTKVYTDFTAQIIQHEIDHLNGILI